MDDDGYAFVAGLRTGFAGVVDPRVQARCDHTRLDIVAVTLLASMCGADDGPEVEVLGRTREPGLRTFLERPNGIPAHDTFGRVFGLLERPQCATGVFVWTQARHEATGGKIIAIDGNTARRSWCKKAGVGALHLVTAWPTESGRTLGPVACAEKSNEITAIPELLRLLDITGATVTIDATGCPKEIAAQVIAQKGDYVRGRKGNQPGLERDMCQLLENQLEAQAPVPAAYVHETNETGHGRIERRAYRAIPIPAGHPQRAIWVGLCTRVVVTRCRIIGACETWETRLYISSHKPRAKKLGTAIRLHWGIENTQHGRWDVAFGEDVRRQQDRNGAANLAVVRRLALGLLRPDKTNTRGRKNKRRACALDPDYLLTVLANAKF